MTLRIPVSFVLAVLSTALVAPARADDCPPRCPPCPCPCPPPCAPAMPTPGASGAPAMPVVPGAPAMPVVPGAPAMPVVPGAPAMPVVPMPAAGPSMAAPAKASLYDRLGGAKAIEAVTDEFLKVLTADPRIVSNPDVAKRTDAIDPGTLRRHIIDFISMAAGGDVAYHGRDMRSAHAGLNITDVEWAAGVEDLVKVLDQFKVPAAERGELLAAATSIKGDVVTGKTLYERLGGLKAIEAVTDDFLGRLTKNEIVMGNAAVAKRLAAANGDALRMHVIFFIAKATGGPVTYTGRDMKSSHTGLGITDAEWNAAAGDLTATLDVFKVPETEKNELLGAVSSLKADIVQAAPSPSK